MEHDPLECAADAICEWIGGTCKIKRITRYPGKDATNVPCDADTECMYDTISRACQPNCARITKTDECVSYTMCESSIGRCKKQCQYKYPTQKPCDADACVHVRHSQWEVHCNVQCSDDGRHARGPAFVGGIPYAVLVPLHGQN